MTARRWRKVILEQARTLGTYRESFDPVIRALADILERRDETYKDFQDSGAEPVIYKKSSQGENLVKNPRLQVWMDLNAQALAYWRDLGLTPAGLKKIDEAAMKPKRVSSLVDALRELNG